MLEMIVKQLGVNARDGHPVVLLKEKDGQRVMPIWVGPAEFKSISLALSKSIPPRPQTHDLMVTSLHTLGYQTSRLEITEIMDDAFFAKLYLSRGKSKNFCVDCRPSDGIALALRDGAPIFALPAVLDAAGYPGQEFEQQKDDSEFKKFIQGLKASDFNSLTAGKKKAEATGIDPLKTEHKDAKADPVKADQPDENTTQDRESNDRT